MPSKLGKVVVAMSGGVDSSVAAALLMRQGYEVVGVFLRLGSPDGVENHADESAAVPPSGKGKQGCCSVLDAADARRVAGILGVPFYVLNFQEDFGRIIDYFVSEYNRGRTPNPCVRCNDWLKFGRLAQYAEAAGADFIASGHYARIGVDPTTGSQIAASRARPAEGSELCAVRHDSKDAGSYAASDRRYGKARGSRDRGRFESAGI